MHNTLFDGLALNKGPISTAPECNVQKALTKSLFMKYWSVKGNFFFFFNFLFRSKQVVEVGCGFFLHKRDKADTLITNSEQL